MTAHKHRVLAFKQASHKSSQYSSYDVLQHAVNKFVSTVNRHFNTGVFWGLTPVAIRGSAAFGSGGSCNWTRHHSHGGDMDLSDCDVALWFSFHGKRTVGSLTSLSLSVCLPDGVVEGQILLPELWLRAQGQVDLQVAVLHPLGRKFVLRFGQHGWQWDTLRHGLLMVAADENETASLNITC